MSKAKQNVNQDRKKPKVKGAPGNAPAKRKAGSAKRGKKTGTTTSASARSGNASRRPGTSKPRSRKQTNPSKPRSRKQTNPSKPRSRKQTNPSKPRSRKQTGAKGTTARKNRSDSRRPRRTPTSVGRKRSPEVPATHRPWATWLGAGLTALAILLAGLSGLFLITPGPGKGTFATVRWPSPAPDEVEASNLLARAGLIRSPWLMSFYLRFSNYREVIAPGTHLLRDNLEPRQLLRVLERTNARPSRTVTVPEGFNKFAIAKRMERRGICPASAFIEATRSPRVIEKLDSGARDAEGYLFPATYDFYENTSAVAVVLNMSSVARHRYDKVFSHHKSEMDHLHDELSWNRYQVITLASVIEKEAARDDERPLIASVFLNRLSSESFRPSKRLQSDPTALYGCLVDPTVTPTCSDTSHGVTAPMVHDPLNPYSTYAHPGLPPGPICNPGIASIRAVLAPAKTDYLYFVAKGKRQHQFSKTYRQHRNAVNRTNHAP